MRQRITMALCVGWLGLQAHAHAMGLLESYQRALHNDPQFQAAIQDHEAGQEYRALGRAALLPRVAYSYSRAKNQSDVTQNTLRGDFQEERRYGSYVSTLSLQQPLFDYAAYSRYRKGVAQTLLADERFRSQSQQLLIRVLTAYTSALLAQDQIALVQAQKRAFEEQALLNQRQFELGNASKTDRLETQARYNLAQTQEIEAQDNLDSALRELERLVGVPLAATELERMVERLQLPSTDLMDFSSWRELALAHNPELVALRHAVDVAQQDVEQSRAGFLPQLNLYASTSRSKSGSETTYNQRYKTDSVGVQLSIPLFSGGESWAATRQAVHLMEKSRYELDDKVLDNLNQLRKMYNLCKSSAAKIQAYELSVQSAQTLVMATRKSIAAGVRVNLDLLNAEQAYYSALKELSQAKYDYLGSWASLRYWAGVLGPDDLQQVAANFALDALSSQPKLPSVLANEPPAQ